MNRLLAIEKSLINGTSQPDYKSFKDALDRATIEPNEFGRIVYGPHYQARLDALKLIKSHP